MTERLVFGDDGSASADLTWRWIDAHDWDGWRISVVTAQPPPAGAPVGPDRSTLHAWQPPEPRTLSAGHGDVVVEHLLAEADPRLVLDSCEDAALIAVGPRGRGVLKRLHIGSTAEWLVSSHHPLVPVVVVRAAEPCAHVLLCVDGSAHARRAATALAGMPWIGQSHVTVLGVLGGDSEAARGAQEAADLLPARSVDVRLPEAVAYTAVFDVRSVVFDTIDDLRPDLVAMGTRGLGGLKRLALGSTASAVVHHAPCSVLVAHAPAEP